jgi:hypothetical protein
VSVSMELERDWAEDEAGRSCSVMDWVTVVTVAVTAVVTVGGGGGAGSRFLENSVA